PFVRKWFVQQHRPSSARRTPTDFGVSSNTTPAPAASHTAKFRYVVRFAARSSFSASATVVHSSSTRRKVSSIGVPVRSNGGEPSAADATSRVATASPASFIPLVTPTSPGNPTLAKACLPVGRQTTTRLYFWRTPRVGKSKLRPKSGRPVALRSGATNNVEQPSFLMSHRQLATTTLSRGRPAAFTPASSSARYAGGKCGNMPSDVRTSHGQARSSRDRLSRASK